MTPQIPNYEIKRVLGEGGMAVVYLAEHRLLHIQAAIKVLNDEFVLLESLDGVMPSENVDQQIIKIKDGFYIH